MAFHFYFTMPFPEIRKLPCKIERLFDETNTIPKFTYFNPSSAYPYIYVRATEKLQEEDNKIGEVNINHMFLYSYHTNKMNMIDIPLYILKPTLNVHQGIEDTRLVIFENRLWFISTSTHVSTSMQSEMMIGFLNRDSSAIEFMQYLNFKRKPIKNICPFVHRSELFAIDMYSFDMYKIDKEIIGECSHSYIPINIGKLKPCNGITQHMIRGSTSPIYLHGSIWGCIVHEHIPRATKGAHAYVSYWLEFDIERKSITFFSDPFFVSYLGIEFISGIEYYPKEDKVELYLGVQDKNPIVATTTLYNLRIGS